MSGRCDNGCNICIYMYIYILIFVLCTYIYIHMYDNVFYKKKALNDYVLTIRAREWESPCPIYEGDKCKCTLFLTNMPPIASTHIFEDI